MYYSDQAVSSVETKSKKIIMLTPKEQEILGLIAHEYSDKDIAKKLFLSHHTIHTHRKNLMIKLDVRKSTGLVRRGFELGILSTSK